MATSDHPLTPPQVEALWLEAENPHRSLELTKILMKIKNSKVGLGENDGTNKKDVCVFGADPRCQLLFVCLFV